MRKTLLGAGALCLLAALMAARADDVADLKPAADARFGTLAHDIGAKLPSGWHAMIDEHAITIFRQEPAEFRTYFQFANIGGQGAPGGGFGSQKPATSQPAVEAPNYHANTHIPKLVLLTGPKITRANLAEREKHNQERAQALKLLESHLNDLPRRQGMIAYDETADTAHREARTPEQQQRLDAYTLVYKSIPVLERPQFFTADATFNWKPDREEAGDPALQAQMTKIHDDVSAMFSKEPLN